MKGDINYVKKILFAKKIKMYLSDKRLNKE